MTTTYQQGLNDLRVRLDEAGVPRFWQDSSLLNWLVLGCRDVARRTETLIEYQTGIVAFPAVGEYPWPQDALRFHRVEFVPQSTLNPPDVIPLELKTPYEMDSMWGSRQYQQSVYPAFCVIGRGTPGNPRNNGSGVPVFQVFPVPSQSGYFRVTYYALPKLTPLATDNMEVTQGYEDVPVLYAEMMAFRADKDQRWQESQQLYEQSLATMINMTRTLHDQSTSVQWYGSQDSYDSYGGGY